MNQLLPGATSTPAPSAPLSQALQRRKSNPVPILLLTIGLLAAISFALWGYIESQRMEPVVLFVRAVPFGQRITAEDVGTISLARHRPEAVRGIASPSQVIGQYATRNLGVNDLAQPAMLMPEPPTQPVYPNGQQLGVNMVPFPFSVSAIGPVTDRDRVNLGFIDSTGSPDLCDPAKVAAASARPSTAPSGAAQARPYTCRLISAMRVLYIDGGTAYLETTPFQAQALRALQAAGVAMWAERYGLASDELPGMDRLDAGQVTDEQMQAPAPTVMPTPENGAQP